MTQLPLFIHIKSLKSLVQRQGQSLHIRGSCRGLARLLLKDRFGRNKMFHNHSKGNLLNSAEPTQKLGNNSTTSFDMPSSGLPTHSIFRSSTPQMQQNVKSPLHESPSRKKRKQKNMNKIFGACIKALNLKIKREKKEDRELRINFDMADIMPLTFKKPISVKAKKAVQVEATPKAVVKQQQLGVSKNSKLPINQYMEMRKSYLENKRVKHDTSLQDLKMMCITGAKKKKVKKSLKTKVFDIFESSSDSLNMEEPPTFKVGPLQKTFEDIDHIKRKKSSTIWFQGADKEKEKMIINKTINKSMSLIPIEQSHKNIDKPTFLNPNRKESQASIMIRVETPKKSKKDMSTFPLKGNLSNEPSRFVAYSGMKRMSHNSNSSSVSESKSAKSINARDEQRNKFQTFHIKNKKIIKSIDLPIQQHMTIYIRKLRYGFE